MKEGSGTMTLASGKKIMGEWKKNKQCGKGSFTWDKGCYTGDFENDMLHGYGEYDWVDGRKFKGHWKNNMIHGKGKFTWPDGKMYDGEYFEDKKHGFGIFKLADGSKYEGNWQNGKQ